MAKQLLTLAPTRKTRQSDSVRNSNSSINKGSHAIDIRLGRPGDRRRSPSMANQPASSQPKEQPMTSTAASAQPLTTPSNTKPNVSSTKSADPLANKETFLQLLVAQIKNQNPLSPQDGVQFLSQLAQFTDLEQSLGMRQDIATIKDFVSGLKPPTTAA
jgi:flagellar basal-body rod modification protein FlgD